MTDLCPQNLSLAMVAMYLLSCLGFQSSKASLNASFGSGLVEPPALFVKHCALVHRSLHSTLIQGFSVSHITGHILHKTKTLTCFFGRSCLLTLCNRLVYFPSQPLISPVASQTHRQTKPHQTPLLKASVSSRVFHLAPQLPGPGQGRLSLAAAPVSGLASPLSLGCVGFHISASCPPACRAEWRGGDQNGPGAELGQVRLVCSSSARQRLPGRHGAEEDPGEVQEAANWD